MVGLYSVCPLNLKQVQALFNTHSSRVIQLASRAEMIKNILSQ